MVPRLFMVSLTLAPVLASGQIHTHCGPGEKTLFTCSVARKTLSFCSSGQSEDVPPAWIQYRFGRIGAAELVYPATKVSPVGHFKYSSHYGGRWVVAIVQFTTNGHTYVLDAYGNSNIPESDASLLVVTPDGAKKTLQCADPGLHAAAGLWRFEQLGLPKVDKEFDRK